MKVLVIGAGSVGIGLGATLCQGGAEVDFIARGVTKNKIERDGIKRIGVMGEVYIPAGKVGVYNNYSELSSDSYDYILIAAKTPANEEISEALGLRKDIIKHEGKIIFIQNGIGQEQPFLDYFDESIIYHCRINTGFQKRSANESMATMHPHTNNIGSVYGYDIECVKDFADTLTRGGVPTEIDPEIEKALWAKFLFITTLNPIGAILKMSYGELAESAYAKAIIDTLIEETFEIMNAIGAETYWSTADEYREELFGILIPDQASHRSSTLQDIEKGKKTEIDYLTGGLLSLASDNDIVATMHSVTYWLIKAMEEKF